jgi:uncharacterized protein HemX
LTESSDTPTAPESPFGPPPAEALIDQSPPPQVAPEAPAKSTGKALVIVSVLAVVALIAAAVFFVLYRQAVDDTNSAESALADAQTALAESEQAASESEAQLEAAEQRLADAEASLAEAEADLADANGASTDKDAELAEAQASLAEAQAALTESQASLTASEELVERYRVATTDFLALSIETGTGADSAASQCVAEAIVERLGPGALELLVAASQGGRGHRARLGDVGCCSRVRSAR